MNHTGELTLEECRGHLLTGVVGRVAMATPIGPRIVLVAYTVHDEAIVFRTTPYSELSTYGWNTELAFQVDRLDDEARTGWSLVALGRARLVDDPAEVQQIRLSAEPRPWVTGTRNLFVKLPWRQLTGLEIGGDLTATATLPRDRVG